MTGPNYLYDIVCLANSRKNSGRCIAGKFVDGPKKGRWVRPVSERPSGELSEEDRRFSDGLDPVLRDLVRVPFKSQSAHDFQIENHTIDDGYYWQKRGATQWDELCGLADTVKGELWENQSSSTDGHNDRVDTDRAASAVRSFGASLCLLRVKDLKIIVHVEGAAFNNAKRKVRGEFNHSGYRYFLSVTDPKIERLYLNQKDGIYPVGDALLCISLGDPYNGYAYKLIAGVILPT